MNEMPPLKPTRLPRPPGLTYTLAAAMSPPRWFGMVRRGAWAQRELPATDSNVPPISPRFLNTTLNMIDTPGVTSPLRIPD